MNNRTVEHLSIRILKLLIRKLILILNLKQYECSLQKLKSAH